MNNAREAETLAFIETLAGEYPGEPRAAKIQRPDEIRDPSRHFAVMPGDFDLVSAFDVATPSARRS